MPFELGITISNSLENSIDEQQDVPYNFAKRDTPASFLLNYWDDLIFFLLVLGAYLLVWVVHKGAAKTQPKYLPPSLTRKLCILIQNYLLTQLFTTFGDIVFFAVLDLRSMSLASGASVFSLILILVLFLIIIMSLGLYFWLLVKYQRIKEKDAELQKFLEDHQGQQLFYNDFKDSSLIHQVVLFVMVAKDIVFSLIITTLFEHPIVQVMLILTLNFAVIAYYLIKRPFKNNFEAIQQLIYEVIIFIVTIDVTILAFMDDSYTIAFGTRNNIGKFIIILNFIFNFIALLFLLAKIGEVIWEAYKHYKSKRKTHPETIKPKVFADSSISNSIDVNTELQFLNPSKAKVRRGLNERKSLNKKYVFSSVNAMDSQLYSHRTGRPLRDNSSSEDLDKFDESRIIVTDLQAHVSNHESKFTPSFSFNKSRNAGNFQLMQDQASNDEPKITLRPFTFKNVEDNSTTKMLSRKLSSYLYPEETSKMNFSLRTELSSWEKNKIKRLTGTFVRNYKEKNSKAAGAQFNEM